MAKNKNLNSAAKAKNDEFYTQKSDIENELKHYKEFFRDKVIFCNCDDPYESEFFKYFAKRLINEVQDWNGDGRKDLLDVEYIIQHGQNVLTPLEGNGDFRSAECVELLKQADIVVTNPPFSLFREYVAQLMAYDKKFIIIGNQNAITYKEIFPLIKDNKMWLGYGFRGNVGFFYSKYEDYANASQHREGMIRISGIYWFTNLDIKKRHEDLPLVFSYEEEPEKYPRYDNYDAIEVSKTADIPYDYDSVMGVPITFLDKYNPAQFEIVGRADANIANENNPYHIKGFKDKGGAPLINGKFVYKRILIRRR